MATLEDIARELAVSKSTVSKALNGARDVSQTMRRTVLEKALEMGYSRIPHGVGDPKIALFITNMEYQKPEDFGYEIILGFRKAAEPAGFQVEIIQLDLAMQQQIYYDEYMAANHYKGALFLGLTPKDPWLREFARCQTPTILYDNYIRGNPNISYIGVDNAEGMDLAVEYLKSLGHRAIGYLGSDCYSFIYKQRFHAFLQAMEDHSLSVDPELTGNTYHLSEVVSQHLPRLLEKRCTAIVCSHDMLAHSVMYHCAELGLRIPEDISILGFDDIPLCRYTAPPLTTIRQDRADLGKSAFFALTNLFNQVPLGTFLLHAPLVIRNSCAKPPEAEN